MTPLRQRLIEDLTLRGYADRTIATYVGVVARLAGFYHAAPDGLTEDQLRTYLLQLSTRRAPASITQALSGLRFFYEQTLGRRWTILDLARAKRDQKLPVVLSREEVGRVLAAVRVPAYRACLTTIYGCGLRLLEGITLHVQDIDGARGGLHVRRGKGGVDRVVPLPTAVLGYLLTFTLPHQLRAVARRHQRVVYAALLREAAAAVQTLARDRQWVGGTVGILAVLHTWSRTMEYHPHAHLLVTAGALASDGRSWVKPAHARFLMPGYALSCLFRAKLRDALARAGLLDAIEPRVWRRRWTVHVQQIGRGEQATLYLSRYVYRVALTNDRIDQWADGRVTFHYTHARTGTTRRVTLPVHRFLDRFLQHVLPRGFTKVRSYGLLSPGRRADLERARGILTSHTPNADAPSSVASAPTSQPSQAVASAGDATWSLALALVVLGKARRCSACERGLVSTVTLRRHCAPRPPP